MSAETDVIIIGAGAAGLSAAWELNRIGLTYTLVEGSHRIGGRAYSEELAPGVWFDLGCAWLNGGATNPFAAIADAMGITLGEDKSQLFEIENHRFQRNGVPLSPDERAACLKYYDECHRAIAATADQNRDVAISEVIDLENMYAPPLCGNIATSWGYDVDRVSTADFACATGTLGSPALHGYGNLVAAWGADLPVSLNAPVKRVDWSGPGVAVETSKGSIRGRTALCTVSTGILSSGDIGFAPGLPDWKTEAIDGLPMGTENKMGVYFDTDVFGTDGRGHYTTWNNDGSMAKIHACVMGQNTAAVFVGGSHAIWLETQGEQACHDFAVDRIADIFGNGIRRHVGRSIVTAWSREAWTLGSWACARPGQAFQRANLARSVDDRLFFAGEATVYGGQGTCDGAYRSGIRTAREIAAQLGSVP